MGDELKSLTELAHAHGQIQNTPIKEDSPFSALHAQCDVVHGWSRHKFYQGQEVKLSDADYLDALEAAKEGEVSSGADHHPLTVFSQEESEAKLASDLAATKSKSKPLGQKASLHGLTMAKAHALASSAGTKSKGGK